MIYVLIGRTASGKDTAREFMVNELGCQVIVPCTTRPMRDGEVEGREYHFFSEEEFMQKRDNGELLEYRSYNHYVNGETITSYYGTEAVEFDDDKDYVLVNDIEGLVELVEKIGQDRCKVLLMEADKEVRRKRCMTRSDYADEEFERRDLDDDMTKYTRDRIKELDHVLEIVDSNMEEQWKHTIKGLLMHSRLKKLFKTDKFAIERLHDSACLCFDSEDVNVNGKLFSIKSSIANSSKFNDPCEEEFTPYTFLFIERGSLIADLALCFDTSKITCKNPLHELLDGSDGYLDIALDYKETKIFQKLCDLVKHPFKECEYSIFSEDADLYFRITADIRKLQ